MSGLNVAIPLLADLQGFLPNWPWQIHALIGFIVFIGFMWWIIWNKQKRIEEYENKVNLFTYLTSYSLNCPILSTQPLKRDEISIKVALKYEIFTTIDLNMAELVLNVIGIHKKRLWRPFKTSEHSFALRIEGHDTSVYHKQIKCSESQPFEDFVTFKWKGDRDEIKGENFIFELVIKFGSPNLIKRARIDIEEILESLRDIGV